jgi:hypothetical protein
MEIKVEKPPIDYLGTDYIPPYVQDGFWPRIELVVDLIATVRHRYEPVVDLGCNAGHLLERVGPPCWGYDIALSPLGFGKRAGHDVRYADVTKDQVELAGIVALSEVCEHIDDPHDFNSSAER